MILPLILNLLPTIIAFLIWLAIVITLTLTLNPLIQRILDWRTQPKVEETTKPGERVELIRHPDYLSVTVWPLLQSSIPHVIGVVVINTVLAFSAYLVGTENALGRVVYWLYFGAQILISLTLLRFPFQYWKLEWHRRNNVLIVLTLNVIHARARISLLGVITGEGALPNISRGELAATGEIRWAADIQDLDRDIHTGFMQDMWQSWRFARAGVATVYLLSFFRGAADRFISIAQAESFVAIVNKLKSRAALHDAATKQVRAQLQKTRGQNIDNVEDAMNLTTLVEQELTASLSPPITFQLFRAEDPGHWTPEGDPATGHTTDNDNQRSYLEVTSD